MKILFTSQYNSQNTYVKDIVDELIKNSFVVTEPQNFWISNLEFDIVHIQWPEELFYWRKIVEEDLIQLKKRLDYYKSTNTKIVATLHNKLPHRKQDLDQKLYDLVYNSADAIINLGEYSTQIYSNTKNIVIEHPNYSKHYILKNKKKKENIFLSFGSIRDKKEEQQIVDAFIKSNITNAKLIISNSIIGRNPFQKRKKDIVKMYLYNYRLNFYKKNNIEFISKRLSNQEVEDYFNNADFIIAPRIDNLNSGVVIMGYTFGKTVIGPAIGNIKELLDKNNNPTFIPNDVESIANAMKAAISNTQSGILNFNYSEQLLEPDRIGKEHLALYKKLRDNLNL